MSVMYFCGNTDLTKPFQRCAAKLRDHDPATYELIHAIYRGSTDLLKK